MCDCIKKSYDLVREKLEKEKNIKGYQIESLRFERMFSYPGDLLYSNIIIEETFEKKDGTRSKPKKDNVIMYFNYCPFCGKELFEDENENN